MPDKNAFYLQFPIGTPLPEVRRRCIERFGREPLEIYTNMTPSGKQHSIFAGPYPSNEAQIDKEKQ